MKHNPPTWASLVKRGPILGFQDLGNLGIQKGPLCGNTHLVEDHLRFRSFRPMMHKSLRSGMRFEKEYITQLLVLLNITQL